MCKRVFQDNALPPPSHASTHEERGADRLSSFQEQIHLIYILKLENQLQEKNLHRLRSCEEVLLVSEEGGSSPEVSRCPLMMLLSTAISGTLAVTGVSGSNGLILAALCPCSLYA